MAEPAWDHRPPALALEWVAWIGARAVEHRPVLAPGDRVTLTAAWGAEPVGQP